MSACQRNLQHPCAEAAGFATRGATILYCTVLHYTLLYSTMLY